MTRRVTVLLFTTLAAFPQQPNITLQSERIANMLDQHRVTGDPAHLAAASLALAETLQLAPDNFQAKKLEARKLLAEGKTEPALRAAAKLNKSVPDDLELYGILADANMQLGRLDEAERNIQWMLNMRPDDYQGRMRAANFRFVTGDIEGAVSLFNDAYHRIPSIFPADRAWVLVRLSEIRLQGGDQPAALRLAVEAARIAPSFPDAKKALERASQPTPSTPSTEGNNP